MDELPPRQPPSLSERIGPAFVKSALGRARIKTNKNQEKFVRLFNEHKALAPGLLNVLERDRSFATTRKPRRNIAGLFGENSLNPGAENMLRGGYL
jgi:hypothetical protein